MKRFSKLPKYLSYVKSNYSEIIGKDSQIQKILTFLSLDRKQNAILLGEEGSGRKTIAKEIARILNSETGPERLYGYRLVQMDIDAINSLESKKKQKKSVNKIAKYCKKNSSKIVLYVENYETIDNCKYSADFIRKAIANYTLKIFISLNIHYLNVRFDNKSDLIKTANFISLQEMDIYEVERVLQIKAEDLRWKYNINISDLIIKYVAMTSKFLADPNYVNPELSISALEFSVIDAKNNNQDEVQKSNLLLYYDFNTKLNDKMDENEKKITAYHEIGHYLVAKLSKNLISNKNAFVSILPIGDSLGITAEYYEEGKLLTYSRDYFIDQIAFAIGGRVGEALYTNEISAGADSDLEHASELAENMVMSYGFSDNEKIKNVSLVYQNQIKAYRLTDSIKDDINNEIAKIIDEAYTRAEEIINSNEDMIHELVKNLMKDGIMIGLELNEIIEKYSKKSIS